MPISNEGSIQNGVSDLWKGLYDNGEYRFNCPFCGAEVVGGRMEQQKKNSTVNT